MNKPKILSGDELVARGITKIDGTLPEVGLKDVVPSGSWLEQKQVQSALEARKHLIEIERIEKSGSLSHAVWCEDLMLAEVTQKVGGHWQYLGHNVGKHLYLYPEEALLLMELNALQLKHNDVTVSLQQAYSLLLRSKVSLLQYKVYASLSRVGYKVFRHEHDDSKASEVKNNEQNQMIVDANESKSELSNCDNDTNRKVDNVVCNEPQVVDLKNKIEYESEMLALDEKQDVAKTMGEDEKQVDVEDEKENVEKIVSETEGCSMKNIIDNEAEKIAADEKQDVEKTIGGDVEKQVDVENGKKEVVVNIVSETEGCSMDTLQDFEVNKTESKDENIPLGVSTENVTNNIVEEMNNESCDETMQEEACDKQIEASNVVETNEVAHSIEKENPMDVDTVIVDSSSETLSENHAINIENNCIQNNPLEQCQNKLRQLQSRRLRPCNAEEIEKSFQIVPEMCHNKIVTVKVPSKEHIPKNVFLNNINYVLNVESIRSKKIEADTSTNQNCESPPQNTITYIRSINQAPPNFSNGNQAIFNTTPLGAQFRHFPFMRTQRNMAFLPWNLLVNLQHIRTFPRPPPTLRFPNIPYNNNVSSSTNDSNRGSRKRTRHNPRKYHMNSITMLAQRLRILIASGTTQTENVIALQRLIDTYNMRYRTNLKLSANFEIIDNDNVIETINLDVDEAPKRNDVTYDDNLNIIKQLAQKLKDLDATKKATSKHRRVLSNLIKRFNKSYKADIILKNNEVVEKNLIILDSSSESDCVVEEPPKKITKSSKKLKNPFNILKRLSEKQHTNTASSTQFLNVNQDDEYSNPDIKKYSVKFVNLLGNWLPMEDDFGRAEVPTPNMIYECILDQKRGEYLCNFIRDNPDDFSNWSELKIGLLKAVEAAQIHIESTAVHPISMAESKLNPLIGPEDCIDMSSILEKLSVIKKCTDVNNETQLQIDFDVYNRDVMNFKKTNKPKPHFRVICVSESRPFPSGSDVATLHSAYTDEVPIIFAAVGIESISYLQVNPFDLPVYVPNSDYNNIM